ncbi:ester cyclase [Nocardia lijiangensis]|uniref:ester cyclase n=1 Tax=Nocardia lijiangensis TaxID=299618 RepID=UPI00083621FA|nr:ester cyclase [Nocardia lijiangensis]
MPTAQETNKATLERLHDALNSRDSDLIAKTIDEVVAPDAVIRTPAAVDATGPRALEEVFGRLHRAFPDLHIAVEDSIAEGDKVVSRNTVTGTHTGEYLGLPPTGKPISYREIFIFRFVDGRIVESWGVVDTLALMRQLGGLPGGLS